MTLLEDAAAFAHRCAASSVGGDVLDDVKAHILDTIGTVVVADRDVLAKAESAAVAGGGGCHQPQDLALLGAVAADVSGISDFDERSRTHPGGVIIPALFASVTPRAGTDAPAGAAVLVAAIVGYEVMLRLADVCDGTALRQRGLHPTSFWGLLGGAAAVAHAHRDDPAVVGDSLGLAASLAGGVSQPGGSAEVRSLQVGWAAKGAVAAAGMAQAGYRASPRIFDHPKGLFGGLLGVEVDNDQFAGAFRGEVGDRLRSVGVSRHVYFTDFHAATDAVMAATDALTTDPWPADGMPDIQVFVPAAVLEADGGMEHPTSASAARRSLRFAVAAVACHYQPGRVHETYAEVFTPAGLDDERVRATARSVRVQTLDAALESTGVAAKAVLSVSDGRVAERAVTGYWGDARAPEHRWTWDEVAARFVHVTAGRLAPHEQELCMETVQTLERSGAQDVAGLISLALKPISMA